MAQGKWVAYYRVSTARQGSSGLGLDAQRKAVEDYLNGGRWTLAAEFTEIESGKDDRNRPQLDAAFQACRSYGATLVIAKIDRLSRDAHFLLGLQKAGIKFVAADMPEANEMVVGIMAVVAQAERKMISKRTKAALAAAKARGQKLGGFKGYVPSDVEWKAATAALKAKAKARARDLAPIVAEIRAAGNVSLGDLARALTARGIPTSRGVAQWTTTAASRLVKLIDQPAKASAIRRRSPPAGRLTSERKSGAAWHCAAQEGLSCPPYAKRAQP